MSTAQALSARRKQARRGHLARAKAERRYAPSAEALSVRTHDVSISVGDV